MTTLEAIVLGIIQGITEFFPVCSSGHLVLLQNIFGITDTKNLILFDLVLHMGTLCAIFCVFYKKIFLLFTSERKLLWQVFVGTLPLFIIVLFISKIKEIYSDPRFLGPFFLLTALLLYLGIRQGKEKSEEDREKHRIKDALLIGLFQVIAIFPGVSRSGSTISGARMLGWSYNDAITFSFLLAIPAILGGTLYELLGAFRHGTWTDHVDNFDYFVGFLFSFFVGYATLRMLIVLASKNKFRYFVWYCLVLGVLTTLYFNR